MWIRLFVHEAWAGDSSTPFVEVELLEIIVSSNPISYSSIPVIFLATLIWYRFVSRAFSVAGNSVPFHLGNRIFLSWTNRDVALAMLLKESGRDASIAPLVGGKSPHFRGCRLLAGMNFVETKRKSRLVSSPFWYFSEYFCTVSSWSFRCGFIIDDLNWAPLRLGNEHFFFEHPYNVTEHQTKRFDSWLQQILWQLIVHNMVGSPQTVSIFQPVPFQ